MNIDGSGIDSIVWATGYRPDLSWPRLPVLDRKGYLRHDGGIVTDLPGLYCLGATFLRRCKSSFIHGAKDDATGLAAHLANFLPAGRKNAWNTRAIRKIWYFQP